MGFAPKNLDNCAFLSYGIQQDWSFDTDMGNRGCKGFAFDPTVRHPFSLTKNVAFMRVGAPVVDDRNPWHSASPVLIANTMGLKRMAVVKMDCEGCEYAIAASILDCEPGPNCDRWFFHKVEQFSVEIHTYMSFAPTYAHHLGLAKLFWLLEEAGLVFIEGTQTPCGPGAQKSGCVEEFVKRDFNCMGCKNFLFARVPT